MTDARDFVDEILHFWFEQLEPSDWFGGGSALDERIQARFGSLHREVAASPPADALKTPENALATVIVLDQFSRNLHRGTGDAFAQDADARRIAREAIQGGLDKGMSQAQRQFLYMPFMHSEVLEDQQLSMELFAGTHVSDYAVQHHDIVAQFGRFPYRNAALDRQTTPEEAEWLKTGTSFGQ